MRVTTASRVFIALAALALAACGGGDGRGPSGDAPGDTSPEEVAFTSFVRDVLSEPANAEPVSVNDRRFRFDDRGDPDAFDDVLQ